MNLAMTQQSFEPQYLGRVMGLTSALMGLAGPIGLVFAAPLAGWLDVQNMLVIAGLGGILAGLLLWIIPQVRNYDKNLQKILQREE